MGKYDDIIHLPRPVSQRHARMPMASRAAQFSSFAALTGYEDAIEETARLTDVRIELDEDAKAEIDRTLQRLAGSIRRQPNVRVTYFCPDERKAGGAYRTAEGALKRIDEADHTLVLQDGTYIHVEDLCAVSILDA